MCSSSEGPPRVNLVEQILEQGQRLRNAMVESILTHDPLYNHFTARPNLNTKLHAICMDEEKTVPYFNEFPEQKCLPERELSTQEKHKFLAYLRGDEMSSRDEKQALETFRAMSNNDICEITQRSFSALQNKCDCDTCKAYKNLNLKFDVPPLDLKSSRLDSKCSYNENFLKYVDTLKIAVHSLRLNHEGDVKVSSSFTKSQKNVRMSDSLAVTYFIEYDVPSIVVRSVPKKAKVDTGLGSTNVVKLCSKKLHNEAIYFKQISIHDVGNLDRLDLYDVDIKFTVSCRSVRQKGVSVIGYAKFNMGSFLDAGNFSCNQELAVVLKESTPVVLGKIKIGLQLGAGRLYYGKEFLDSVRNSKETDKILPGITSCDNEDFIQSEVNEVPKEIKKHDFKVIDVKKNNKQTINTRKGKNETQEKHNLREIAVQSEDPRSQIVNKTILFGFIYISEVEYLDTKESTYFTCQPFCQSDLIHSSPVNGGSNPIFNFQQKIPIIYEEAFVSKLRDNFMVFEFWEKRYYKDELIGVCSIPLHQYYLAFRNPVIVDYLNRNKLPVIGTDWYEPISHPTQGTISGQVLILIALGSESQISNLEKERGFKDNIVTRAKQTLITKRPLLNEPLQIPERERVTFKSLRQRLNSAKEILSKNSEVCTSDQFRLVDDGSKNQYDRIRSLGDEHNKSSDNVRLDGIKINYSEGDVFYDRSNINSDNSKLINPEEDYNKSKSVRQSEENRVKNIGKVPSNKNIKILDDRLIHSGKNKSVKGNREIIQAYDNQSDNEENLDSFRILAERKKVEEHKIKLAKNKGDKIRRVFFEDGEVFEKNDADFYDELKDRRLNRLKILAGEDLCDTDSESYRVDLNDYNKNAVSNFESQVDLGCLNKNTVLGFEETIVTSDKTIAGDYNKTVINDYSKTVRSDCNKTVISDCNKTVISDCNKTITGDCNKIITGDCNKTITGEFNKTITGEFNKNLAGDFNETITGDKPCSGDFNKSTTCVLNNEARLSVRNNSSETKNSQTESSIIVETSKYNSRQSNPSKKESNLNHEITITKCDKSTQKSDTLDKAVQYEEIMEDQKKDTLENLLQQLITNRQTATSNAQPSGETRIDNTKTPLTINCNSKNSNLTSKPPDNSNVRKTGDLLDTLNKALSIDCSAQFKESFKAHVIVESALHLPTRVKCKARKGKGGRSSTEKILPSTYVSFETDKEEIRMTHVVQRNSNPKWDYRCDISLPSDLLVNNHKRLIFKVWKKANNSSAQPNMQVDSVIGFAAVDLTVLLAGLPAVHGWYNIVDFSSKCNGQMKISVSPLENISRFNLNKNNSNQVANNPEPVILSNESQEEPGELLSRALKRKFIELDEITQRLRSRLSNVTNEESDTSNDDIADEFDRDINTLCVEDDFDMLNFVHEAQNISLQKVSDSLMKWQGVSQPDNQTLMVFTGDSEPSSEASCSKTIESTDCTHLDRQLTEGKNRIDTLLQKLSLIPKNNDNQNVFSNENEFSNQIPTGSEISNQRSECGGFSSRYVSGCSDVSKATPLRTNEEILLELGVKDDDFDPSRLLDADLLMEGLKSSSESSMRDIPDGEGDKVRGN